MPPPPHESTLTLSRRTAVRDREGRSLPLSPRFGQGWLLSALTGGYPFALFGEWNGESLQPLSLWAEGCFYGVMRSGSGWSLAIIALVGEGIKGAPGVAARAFGTLGAAAINIMMIAQGSSELCLSLPEPSPNFSDPPSDIGPLHTD